MKKIFILHGWSYTTERWEPFLESLKKRGYEPTLLKIPGLTAPLSRVWGLQEYVTWLRKHLQKEREVVLLGHSNGGRIALAYAVEFPEQIRQLILIDTAGLPRSELVARAKRMIFRSFARLGKKISTAERGRNILYWFTRERDYAEATPLMRETMKRLIQTNVIPLLPLVKVRTLIIWGAQDRVTPFKDAKILHEGIRGSRLVSIPEARHSPQFSHYELVSRYIAEFLRET